MAARVASPWPGDSGAPAGARGRANLLLWSALVVLVLTVVLGRAWDAAWHATHVFDTFYSPPHLFIYGMTLANVGLVAWLGLAPGMRAWFGPGFRLPALPFAVPGALALLGGGFALLALAGVLDNIWHSNFGLDETVWSAPHAMLGTGWLTIILGFVACRLALRPGERLPWYTAVLLGYLLLGFSANPLMGPFFANTTPDRIRAVAAIPALAAQPAAQHTFRIYLDWHLDRTNALLIPLGALWLGAVLASLRRLDGRARVLLLVVTLFTVTSALGEHRSAVNLAKFVRGRLAAEPTAWLPLPILPATLAYLALRSRVREGWAWAVVGSLFGLGVWLIWRAPLGLPLCLAAAPAAWLGARVGDAVWTAIERPVAGRVALLVGLLGVALPLLKGGLDLYLRLHTPWS